MRIDRASLLIEVKLMSMTPLRYYREHVAKISQSQLAKAVGVNKSTISRIETGDTNGQYRTKPEIADAIESHFKGGITRDQILFPTDDRPDGTPAKRAKSRKVNGSRVS